MLVAWSGLRLSPVGFGAKAIRAMDEWDCGRIVDCELAWPGSNIVAILLPQLVKEQILFRAEHLRYVIQFRHGC